MTEQWFVLDVNPEPWEVGPLNVVRKGGTYRPFVGRSQQLDDYKKSVQESLKDYVRKNGLTITKLEGKVSLTIFFWRQMAEYESWQARRHRKHEADDTNLFKSTEDALQGILYDNDKGNNEIHGLVVQQGPNVKAKVVIGVRPGPTEPQILDMIPAHVRAKLEETPALFEPDTQYSQSNPRDLF